MLQHGHYTEFSFSFSDSVLLIMKDLSLACLVFVDLFHPLWLFSCTCYFSRSGVELLVLLTEMLIDFYKTNFSTFFSFSL